MKKFLPSCFKHTSLILIALIFSVNYSYSQAPGVQWQNTHTPSFMSIPMSSHGYCVYQLDDEGYIAAGIGTTPTINAYIVRTDKDGDTIWTAKYFADVDKGMFSMCKAVLPVDDGGFIVYGHGNLDQQMNRGILLLKLNSDGSLAWNKSFALKDNYSFLETSQLTHSNDGGFVMTGYVYEDDFNARPDIFLLKTDAQGNEVFFESYGEVDAHELGYSVISAHDGGYIIAGVYEDDGNPHGEAVYMKISEEGALQQTIYLPDDAPNEYNYIMKTPDGGYAVAGTDGGAFMLGKTDAGLNVSWMKKYGVDEEAEHAYSFDMTMDGGYILTGWADQAEGPYRDLWIVRTDGAGNQKWDLRLAGDHHSGGECIKHTLDGGYIITGYQENAEEMGELWLIKLGADIDGILENATKRNFEVSPNPVRSRATVSFTLEKAAEASLTLFDMQGRPLAELFDGTANEGINDIEFDAGNFAAGMYYCILNISGEKALLLINIVK